MGGTTRLIIDRDEPLDSFFIVARVGRNTRFVYSSTIFNVFLMGCAKQNITGGRQNILSTSRGEKGALQFAKPRWDVKAV